MSEYPGRAPNTWPRVQVLLYMQSHMHTLLMWATQGRPRTWNHWQNHVWSRINIIRLRYILEAMSRTHIKKYIVRMVFNGQTYGGWRESDCYLQVWEDLPPLFLLLFCLFLFVSLVGVWWHFPERFGCNKNLLSSMGFRFFVMYGRRPSYSMSHSCYFV